MDLQMSIDVSEMRIASSIALMANSSRETLLVLLFWVITLYGLTDGYRRFGDA
jgi:hypothetical protein